jgi:formate--tetrahydrofolate ligase
MASTAAEQHKNPKSDIDIAQAATMRPILDVAKEKLGIPGDSLDPYGITKQKFRSSTSTR